MSKDYKLNPSPDYPWFLYDPEGNDFEYYKTEAERDDAAENAISAYCDEEWDESVTNVVVGKVTGKATQVDVRQRPADEELNEEGCDEEGTWWNGNEFDYYCNYKIKPLDYVPEQQD